MTSPQNLPLRLSGSRWILGLWGIWAFAQPSSPLPEAYEAIRRGLTLNAQRLLSRAREHPDSLVRWEAALLQGHLAARAGRENEALRLWYFVSQQSPSSPLGLEAMYLRANLLLRNRSQWQAGLYLLRLLLEHPATPPDLRQAVENRLSYFAFREADLGFLWASGWEGNPTLYPYLSPALRYHLQQACLWRPWQLWNTWVERNCGNTPEESPWTAFSDTFPPETLRVVLLLPFLATQERNSPFLEFWQGFELGLRESRSPYAVWEVEVEDSERSLSRIRELLTSWEDSPPHIIIGEVSWSLNQLIADFCERKGIWHAIPINPVYPKRRFSFPLVLPAECHGKRIGGLLRESFASFSPLRSPVVCLYDTEDPQATAYVEGLRQAFYLPVYALSSSLTELTRRWSTLKDTLTQAECYVLAFTNEEALGFLLHKLGRDTLPPLVVGMESWAHLRHTHLRDYWRLRLWVPQSLLPDSANWIAFTSKVSRLFHQRPSSYHAQGYDAARWLASLSASYARFHLPSDEEGEGLLNRYTLSPICEKYRWRLWEYERGEMRIRYESP
ncbi:MAG: hypothetical protein N2170_01105 [Bacteroidia bacterium]|nr:hypothetical protein [Bacteroidia bacterium]